MNRKLKHGPLYLLALYLLARYRKLLGISLLIGCGLAILGGYLTYLWHSPTRCCTFRETVFAFGATAVGDTLCHRFQFQNTGSDIIRIGRVVSSCGCVVGTIEKKNYRPGESGTLSVNLSTDGRAAPGLLEQSVWFEYSRQGRVAGTKLTVTANLIPDIECVPRKIKLVRKSPSHKLGSRLTIHRRMLDPDDFLQLRIEGVSSQYTLHEVSRDRETIVAQVLAVPGNAYCSRQAVILRYQRGKVGHFQRVDIQWPEWAEQVALRPSSYVATAPFDRASKALATESKRTVQLVSLEKSNFVISAIEVAGDRVENLLEWQVTADAPDEFTLWLNHFPQNRNLVHAKLTINYCEADGKNPGTCMLPVYISRSSARRKKEADIALNPPGNFVANQ